MKKFTLVIISVAVFSLLSSFNIKHNGGQLGTSGSPGEGTCNGCHFGGPAGTTVSITAVPDFSANVFDPNITYTITITVAHPSLNRFGFNCEILGPTNTNAGTIANPGPGLFLFDLGAKKNATHNGVQTGTGSFSWTFEWTPPPGGNATIYASGNAVNLDGGTFGDAPANTSRFLTTLNTGVVTSSKNSISGISIYPNPANEFTNVSYFILSPQKTTIEITEINGKILKSFVFEENSAGSHSHLLDLKGLAKGIYFVKTSVGNEKISQKLISVI